MLEKAEFLLLLVVYLHFGQSTITITCQATQWLAAPGPARPGPTFITPSNSIFLFFAVSVFGLRLTRRI